MSCGISANSGVCKQRKDTTEDCWLSQLLAIYKLNKLCAVFTLSTLPIQTCRGYGKSQVIIQTQFAYEAFFVSSENWNS